MSYYYSAATYLRMGKFPPLAAPDHVWAEWFRLRDLESEEEQA